jgi:cystathionine gamma-lyase
MAATALALELLEHGSHLIVMNGVYGGTFRLFEKVRRSTMGLEFTYLDLNDTESVRKAIRPNTRMIWAESPTNPLLGLVDIRKLAHDVQTRGPSGAQVEKILLCVDNTFATAWNQQPLKLGADVVMISSSKFIGGHSDMTGGALVTNDETLGNRLKFLNGAVGGIANPFDAYLALRGMKTLAVRMERQCSNAAKVASFLEGNPQVTEVHYPGLSSSPHFDLCKRQMRTGGSVVTIRLRGDQGEAGGTSALQRFFGRLRIWQLVESLGGVESMINHSASMSHASMTPEARAAVGIFDTTLRLSVGIEDVDDLIQDLGQALAA